MKLILTRHGESDENSLGILQGILPGKLSSNGSLQADKLGQRLLTENIDIIYCSPVNRCLETLDFFINNMFKGEIFLQTHSINQSIFTT